MSSKLSCGPVTSDDISKKLSFGPTNKTSSGGGGGEANFIRNDGGGDVELGLSKDGVALPIKTLDAGTNITFDDDGEVVTINASSTGEANTASNLLPEVGGWFQQKIGVDLKFRTPTAGPGISLDIQNDFIEISADVSSLFGSFQSYSTGSISQGQSNLNNVYCIRSLCVASTLADTAALFITNPGVGNVNIGIYDEVTNALIADTGTVPVDGLSGFVRIPFVAPVALTGGTGYWLSYKSDSNGPSFAQQVCFNDADLCVRISNYTTPGLPATLPTAASNIAPWIAVGDSPLI